MVLTNRQRAKIWAGCRGCILADAPLELFVIRACRFRLSVSSYVQQSANKIVLHLGTASGRMQSDADPAPAWFLATSRVGGSLAARLGRSRSCTPGVDFVGIVHDDPGRSWTIGLPAGDNPRVRDVGIGTRVAKPCPP